MAPKKEAKQMGTVPSSTSHSWLMKAEPESRIEKGQDVAFSVEQFRACPDQTSAWEGVRNAEANKLMRDEMRIADDVLFYHSNCKLPGIAGLAKVVKEGYPDFSAWDPSHPYFDSKTDKDTPRWFMVDVQLHEKLPFLVPLALLQYLGSSSCSHSLPYLTSKHLEAIPRMQLLNRGRLSVQRVEPDAFDAVRLLGREGGWQDWPGKWSSSTKSKKPSSQASTAPATNANSRPTAKGKGKSGLSRGGNDEEAATRSSKRIRAKR